MSISNGFDMSLVMSKLFGRNKWRSLNPTGNYPLNYQVGATRPDLFIKAGVSNGLTVGNSIYINSSLTGFNYSINQMGYGVLQPNVDYTDNGNGFTLLTQTFQLGQRLVLQFQNISAIAPSATGGRYFEQFHPLVTLENLRSVIPRQLNDADFYTFLGDLEQGVIMQLLNGIFNEPQIVDDGLLYDRKLRYDNPITNRGKFVGYRLNIASGDYAAQVLRASFIFNGVATFPLYVFQDMVNQPLYSISVTTLANEETYVDLPDWIIKYRQAQSMGGVFYIGYFQDDLGNVNAMEQYVSLWSDPKAMGYTSFEAIATGADTFNHIAIPYSYGTYGMNIEFNTYRDFTNRVIKNASLFDEAIGLMMAVVVLGYQALSTRSNANERITKEMAATIYGELNNAGFGNESNPFVAGLKKQVERETKRINQNIFPKPFSFTSRPAIFLNNIPSQR